MNNRTSPGKRGVRSMDEARVTYIGPIVVALSDEM